MTRPSSTAFPLHELIAQRWSPRAYSDRLVAAEDLGSILEAARWAPSCFNEQPWTYLVATRDRPADFARLSSCLMEGNAWAKHAPVLALSVAKLHFDRNGQPNRHALHDVGLATANLTVQAEALGLSVHQMGGFDATRARQELGIPDGFDPVAMIAIGYRAEPDRIPEDLREREMAPRERKGLATFVFGATWGVSSELFADGR